MTRETISFTNKTDSVDDVLAAHINTLQNYLAKLWNTFAFVGATELTISSGAVTVTGNYHTIDTEGDAASDDLESISLGTDIEEASLLIFRPENDARTVVVKHGTGNLLCVGGSDFTLDDEEDFCIAVYDAGLAKWLVMFGGGGQNILSSGWIPVSDTWSYSASNKITVPSGAQSKYPNYCKIRWKQGGSFKYAYAKPTSDTELTIYAGSDYTVANSAITDVYYSVSECPIGFPRYHNWTPVFTGFSADPTVTCKFWIIGNLIYFGIYSGGNGTSNATTFKISVPVPSNGVSGGVCNYTVDNGSLQTGAARWGIGTNQENIAIYANMATAEWTASGGKTAVLNGFYPI